MTREEFEAAYAERSGMTIELLHELGRHAIRCDCGLSGCDGWQMIRVEVKRRKRSGRR